MTKVIHAPGKVVTSEDKRNHTYLANKMGRHTLCGYLFDNTDKHAKRLSVLRSEINCKLCNKLLPK